MNAFLHESSFNYERCPEPENIEQKFKEVIRAAPRNTEWTAFTDLFQYEDSWHSPRFLEGAILAQKQFQARPSDIILCSAPKTGTTWLKALSFAVVNRAVCLDDSKNPLLFNTPHECVPYLEVDLFQNKSTRYPDSPLLATHLTFDSLLNSIIASDCKIVYICRDPKDVFCFSLALHRKCESQGRGEVIYFGKAFELFCQGASFNGPYWDHVLGYWKASLKLPKKILFLKYEDLKRKTEFYLERLAEVIGHSFSANEMREGAVGKIMQLCSFQILSKLEVNKTGEYAIFSSVAVENNKYLGRARL